MRRTIAIAVVALTMVGAVAIGGGLLMVNATAKTTTWVATDDLPAGTTVTTSTVHSVRVPTGTDSVTAVTTSPAGRQLAHPVSAGDVLRPDDFVTSAMVQVPASFKLAPGLAANDAIDIYAVSGGGGDATGNTADGTRLIARDVSVVSVGSPSVIQVPANQEALWVTLASAGVTLIAARSTGINVPSADHTYNAGEVVDILAQLAAAGDGGSASQTSSTQAPPSATPTSAGGR